MGLHLRGCPVRSCRERLSRNFTVAESIDRQSRTFAIQLHEGTSAAGAEDVDCSGDQLLASTRFTENQYGGIRRCYLFHLCEYGFESRAVANYLAKSAFSLTLFKRPTSADVFHR